MTEDISKMTGQTLHPMIKAIIDQRPGLTPKGKLLADYIVENPRKVIFMTTRELSEACGVSEATVVRFVAQVGFRGYTEFLQSLRNAVDADMTLLDRMELTDFTSPSAQRFQRMIYREMDNLRQLYEEVDVEAVERVTALLDGDEPVYVVGSRLSYTLAYYMGWSLIKIRPGIQILKGSDSTAIDRLTVAPADSRVIVIATSRYPNELIRICRCAIRLRLKLVVLSDSADCPMNGFAHEKLIAPSRHIPIVGNPTALSCLINHLFHELAARRTDAFKAHQGRLEVSYRENDILFNIEKGR